VCVAHTPCRADRCDNRARSHTPFPRREGGWGVRYAYRGLGGHLPSGVRVAGSGPQPLSGLDGGGVGVGVDTVRVATGVRLGGRAGVRVTGGWGPGVYATTVTVTVTSAGGSAGTAVTMAGGSTAGEAVAMGVCTSVGVGGGGAATIAAGAGGTGAALAACGVGVASASGGAGLSVSAPGVGEAVSSSGGRGGSAVPLDGGSVAAVATTAPAAPWPDEAPRGRATTTTAARANRPISVTGRRRTIRMLSTGAPPTYGCREERHRGLAQDPS